MGIILYYISKVIHALFLHLIWCLVEKQAKRDSGSVDQVSHYETFREQNHEERSLSLEDKQKMSATSHVQKRRRTSITHQCKYCKKLFSRLYNLQQHMLTHTGEKPHECTECQKRFTLKNHLNRHMLTHTGEKPHKCSKCHRKFSLTSTLQCHMLTHTGKKPHKCVVCQRGFSQTGNLKRHMSQHGEAQHSQ